MMYLAIIAILAFFLGKSSCSPSPEPTVIVKTDTVTIYKTIIDTIYVDRIKLIASKPDTVWQKEYIPDTTYYGLLRQYSRLGKEHFTKNVYSSEFKIADYGKITVYDTIYANKLMSSYIATNLNIPITTITVEKETILNKTELYTGISLLGNKEDLITGIYGNLFLKTKKSSLYGILVGYDGYAQNISYGISFNHKIKLK